jgi:hypothetical protein
MSSGGTLLWDHAAREKHARQSFHEHARNVPFPLEESAVVVAVGGVKAKAMVKSFGFGLVAVN